MSDTRSVDDASILVERTAGLTAVVGTWIMFSAVVFTITGLMGIHNAVVGPVIAFIAAVHVYRIADRHSPSLVVAAVLTLLGLWVAASPFVFGVDRPLVVWNNVVTGVLVAVLSGAGIYGSVRTSDARTTRA